MNILIVGSGGREHALAWKINQSPKVSKLYIAPGNGGTALEGENVAIQDDDIPALVAFAREKAIDLVVAGPELPLVLGLRNALTEENIPCFGPGAFCAQLEGSKAFAKSLMKEAEVPTADFAVFDDYEAARDYVKKHPLPMVIKADGLAAGKGVVIASTMEEAENALKEMMQDRVFGAAGERVVVEEALVGEEASFLAFCDGHTIVPLPSAQDHKRIGEGDTGLNTGGMGAYSPAPILPREEYDMMLDMTIRPIVQHLDALDHPFKGVIYAGLMMTETGPKVLEYNVRFGDPECQPLLMRLDSDIVDIMMACVNGTLTPDMVRIKQEYTMGVVIASEGYPGSYPKGRVITGIEEAEKIEGLKVFQAGTALDGDTCSTSGGRVLCVTALGKDLAEARDKAYQGVAKVHFNGMYFRRDIGEKGLRRNDA